MFFNPNDFRRRQERTGPSGLLEIFSREWLTIVKVDALTCLSLVPLVTLPPALLAMNHMARRMAEDRSVTVREFWQSFRTNFWRSYPTFFLAVLLPVISLWSSFFYAGQAVGNWILFLPCVFSVFVFVVSLLMSAYLFPLAASGMPLGQAVRRALLWALPSGTGADVRSAQRLSGRSGHRISSLQHSLFPAGRTDVPLCGRSGDCAPSSGPVLS